MMLKRKRVIQGGGIVRCLAVTLLGVFIAAAPTDALPLDPFFSISGSWKTPGGNGVVVRRIDGGIEGILYEVPEEAGRYGHALGQTVLRNVSITGTNVNMEVAVRIDDPTLVPLCPVGWAKFFGMVTEATISGELENGDFELETAHNGNVTGCTYVVQPGQTDVTYTRNTCNCTLVPPERKVHDLKWVERNVNASLSLSEPFAQQALTVKVERLGEMPVAHAEVEWTVQQKQKGFTATYRTFSNAAGEARLRMGMLPDLHFAPMNQLTRPNQTLPAGTLTVKAAAPGLETKLEESGLLILSTADAIIQVVDRNMRPIRDIIFDSRTNEGRFRVHVVTPNTENQPETVYVTITTYDSQDVVYGSTGFPCRGVGRINIQRTMT